MKKMERAFATKNIKDDKTKINILFFYGGEWREWLESSDSYEDIVRKLTARYNPSQHCSSKSVKSENRSNSTYLLN